jgi:hypothetical protein
MAGLAAGALCALAALFLLGLLSVPSNAVAARADATPAATGSGAPSGAPGTGGGTGPSNLTLTLVGSGVVACGGGLVALAAWRRRTGVGAA